ncbi:MAG: hemerythrin family protein [Cytophagales bacterium]|nr:hemerythrin family protein [Cytophagales bacterium]
MAFFNWEEKYNINISAIDNQHKKLAELINQLHESMLQGKGNKALGGIIVELVKYTKTHFSGEEVLFEKFNYPETEEHKAEHQRFVDEIQDIQSQLEKGKMGMPVHVFKFLKSWLIDHILGSDKKYVECFRENGVM